MRENVSRFFLLLPKGRMFYGGGSFLGVDHLKSSTASNFSGPLKELGGDDRFDDALRRKGGGIGPQPAGVPSPDLSGDGQRQILEDADGHDGQGDKPFDRRQCGVDLLQGCLREEREVRWFAALAFWLTDRPKMIAKAAQQMFEDVEQDFNFCPQSVDFQDREGWQRQVGRHQDESLVAMLHQDKTEDGINRFPEQVETTIGNGGGTAIARDRWCGHAGGMVKHFHQLDLVAFLKALASRLRFEIRPRIVFGPRDEMPQLDSAVGELLVENQDGGADRKVGVENGITRLFQGLSGRQQQASHPSDERRWLAVKPLRGTQRVHALMDFGLQRQTKEFVQGSRQDTHDSKMVAGNRGLFTVVGGLLMKGFDCRHFAGFLRDFDAVPNQEFPSVKRPQGTSRQYPTHPHRNERVHTPGGGIKKVNQGVITDGSKREPPDKTRPPLMVNAHIQADEDNTKPMERGCSRKPGTKYAENGVKVTKHTEFLLHISGRCTSFGSPRLAWIGRPTPFLLELPIQWEQAEFNGREMMTNAHHR